MVNYANPEDINTFNNSHSALEAFDLLSDFISRENVEAFLLEEDNEYGVKGDRIKFNKYAIDRIDKAKIEIYTGDHLPHHFHLNVAEYKTSFSS